MKMVKRGENRKIYNTFNANQNARRGGHYSGGHPRVKRAAIVPAPTGA